MLACCPRASALNTQSDTLSFQNLGESNNTISYVIQSWGWFGWFTVKTIQANKKPSTYTLSMQIPKGYYRIKMNETSGVTYTKYIYVSK